MIFSFLLANVLLPMDVGRYVVFSLISTYSTSILLLKYQGSIVYKLNNQELKANFNNYFSQGLIQLIANNLLVVLLLLVFVDPIGNLFKIDDYRVYYLIVALIPIIGFNNYFNAVLRARNYFRFLALVQLITYTLGYAFIITAISTDADIIYIFIGQLAINGSLVLIYIFIIYREFSFTLKTDREVSQNLLKFTFILHISAIAVFLDKNIDVFLVNTYMSKADVAIYNYALKIPLLLVLFGDSISQVSYNKLTILLTSKSIEKVKVYYKDVLNLSFDLLMILVILIVINFELIINLLLPEEYLVMIFPSIIIMSSLTLFAAYSTMGTMLTSMGMPQLGTIPNWISLGVNVTLSILLIPIIGILGAAIATSLSFFSRVFISIYFEKKYLKSNMNHSLIISLTFLIFLTLWVVKYYEAPIWAQQITGLVLLGSLAFKVYKGGSYRVLTSLLIKK